MLEDMYNYIIGADAISVALYMFHLTQMILAAIVDFHKLDEPQFFVCTKKTHSKRNLVFIRGKAGNGILPCRICNSELIVDIFHYGQNHSGIQLNFLHSVTPLTGMKNKALENYI